MLPLRVCIQGELDREVEALQTAQSRFRQRLERDPERADKWVSAHARRLELEAASDITTHFEQVTGHSLADLDRDSSRHHTSSPSVRGVAPAGLDEASRRAADRYPIKRARSGSLVLATVMAVFVLTMGSYESDPLQGLTGSAATSESILFGSLGERTRGHMDLASEQRRAEVLLALDRISVARTSVLGFHTGYDPTSLRSALVHLERAIHVGPAHEPVPSELERLYMAVLRMLEGPE